MVFGFWETKGPPSHCEGLSRKVRSIAVLPKLLTIVARARTDPSAGPLQAPSDELSDLSVDVALDLGGAAGKTYKVWLKEFPALNVDGLPQLIQTKKITNFHDPRNLFAEHVLFGNDCHRKLHQQWVLDYSLRRKA